MPTTVAGTLIPAGTVLCVELCMLVQNMFAHTLLSSVATDPVLLASWVGLELLTLSANVSGKRLLADHAATLFLMCGVLLLHPLGWSRGTELVMGAKNNWIIGGPIVGVLNACLPLSQRSLGIHIVNELFRQYLKERPWIPTDSLAANSQ